MRRITSSAAAPRLNKLTTNIPSRWRIASIASEDALILPHRANPCGCDFGNDRAVCAAPSSMYAEHLTATGNHAVLFKISACWPIAQTGLQGRIKCRGSNGRWMKLQWQVKEAFMPVAIIGAGAVGATLGQAWLKHGQDVIWGVRNPADPTKRCWPRSAQPVSTRRNKGMPVRGTSTYAWCPAHAHHSGHCHRKAAAFPSEHLALFDPGQTSRAVPWHPDMSFSGQRDEFAFQKARFRSPS